MLLIMFLNLSVLFSPWQKGDNNAHPGLYKYDVCKTLTTTLQPDMAAMQSPQTEVLNGPGKVQTQSSETGKG